MASILKPTLYIIGRKIEWRLIMRLERVQEALKEKNVKYEYHEEDHCGSLDFLFRGLKYHVWEYFDGVWGVDTNLFEAGRSRDIEGDYEEILVKEILSWPDMIG